MGAVGPLCDILLMRDTKVIEIALDALDNMLRVGAACGEGVDNEVADMIEKDGGLEKIEALQEHPVGKIFDKVQEILTEYFNPDNQHDVDPNAGVSGGQFMFNPSSFGGQSGGYNL